MLEQSTFERYALLKHYFTKKRLKAEMVQCWVNIIGAYGIEISKVNRVKNIQNKTKACSNYTHKHRDQFSRHRVLCVS